MAQIRKSTEIRKQQIIDAARKLIIKKGSEHLTVRSIAKEVNITEAAIYRHFKSKREILSFLMGHILSSMLQEVERSRIENAVTLETLKDILKNHLSEIEQRRGMSFQVIAEIISLGDKKLNKEVYTGLLAYIGRLHELFAEAARSGAVREDADLDAAAMVLFGMIQGLVSIWALSGYQFDLIERYDRLWDCYRRSIAR
jgi:AcrR family transcriptional regulator